MPTDTTESAPPAGQASLGARLAAIPFITPGQSRRWLGLVPALEAVRAADGGTAGPGQGHIEAAERLLNTTTFRLVVCGRTGEGKSSLLNALLGRVLLITGAGTAITGTVVYVEPVLGAGADEELIIDYLTEAELRERVERLSADPAQGNLGRAYNILDPVDRGELKTRTGGQDRSRARESPSPQLTALQLIRHCIEAYEANQGRYHDGRITSDRHKLARMDANSIRDLLHESPELGAAPVRRTGAARGSQLRLIRSATFRIRPGEAAGLFSGGAVTIVDVPGFGASMPWHDDITRTEIGRQESLVLLVLGLSRPQTPESEDSAKWLASVLLGGLNGADRDIAAGKVFVAVNNTQAHPGQAGREDVVDHSIANVLVHLSPGYWETYKARGRTGERPYIETMPLAALAVQDPPGVAQDRGNPYKSQTAEAAHQAGVSAAEPFSPEAGQKILDASGIGLLRDRLTGYIRLDLIDRQIDEAAGRLRAAVSLGLREVDGALAGLGVRPPFGESGEYEDRLCWMELNRLAGVDRNRQDGVPPLAAVMQAALHTSAQAVRPGSARSASAYQAAAGDLTAIKDRVDGHVADNRFRLNDYEAGRQLTDEATNSILLACQADFRDFLHQLALAVADDRLTTFRDSLAGTQLRERLSEASFGQEYPYDLNDPFEMPGDQAPAAFAAGAHTLDAAYDYLLSRFCAIVRVTFANAVTYEDLRGDPSRLFTRIGRPSEPGPDQNLAQRIKDGYDAMLAEIWNDQALAGLAALFGRRLTWFDQKLSQLAADTLAQHQQHFRHNAVLRAGILARTADTALQVHQLLARRARLIQAREQVEAAAAGQATPAGHADGQHAPGHAGPSHQESPDGQPGQRAEQQEEEPAREFAEQPE
jgi:hypothetical protein